MTVVPALAAALVLSVPAATTAPAKKPVLVVPLHSGPGLEQNVADLLTDTLCADIQRETNLRILTQKDVSTMLGVERQRQLLACTESSSCLTEIAGALDADAIVHGSLGRLGDSWIFNLSLVDGRTGAVTQRYSSRRKGSSAEVFLDDTSDAARQLFGGASSGGGVSTSGASASHRLFATARGSWGLPPESAGDSTSFGAALLGLQLTPGFSLAAGALFVRSGGAMVRAAFAPVNAEGRVKPVVALEVPVVLGPSTSVGVALAPGLLVDVLPWLSLGVDVPVTYFVLAPAGAPTFYVFGAATASVRFL